MMDEEEEESTKENPQIEAVEKDVKNLKSDIQARRHFDSLVTARLCKAQDFDLNKSREDRIVINGLANAIPMLVPANEKTNWTFAMVAPIVNAIVPVSADEIVCINLGGNRDRTIPLCEVKFTNRDTAIKIRKTFGEKKKGGRIWGKLAFSTVSVSQPGSGLRFVGDGQENPK